MAHDSFPIDVVHQVVRVETIDNPGLPNAFAERNRLLEVSSWTYLSAT